MLYYVYVVLRIWIQATAVGIRTNDQSASLVQGLPGSCLTTPLHQSWKTSPSCQIRKNTSPLKRYALCPWRCRSVKWDGYTPHVDSGSPSMSWRNWDLVLKQSSLLVLVAMEIRAKREPCTNT